MSTLSPSQNSHERSAPKPSAAAPAASPVRTRRNYAYFQEGYALTTLLLGLLYLTLAISLDAAGWVESMGILVPVTIGAMVMGGLMAFSRFDSFFMLTHGLVTGFAWVVYLVTGLVGDERRVTLFVENGISPLQARAYFLLERWIEWFQAALNNNASNDNYFFILEIGLLVWWLAYLGMWTVFRHGYVWRTVVATGIAVLVNSYYSPQSILGYLIFFCVVALMLLTWTNLVEQRQRWQAHRIYFSQDISFDFMRNGLFYTVAVILIAFVAPSLGRSAPVRDLLQPLNARWEATTAEWNQLYQGINRQTRPVAAAFGRSLTLGGERTVTTDLVFQVEVPQGRYWRAVSYDTFTGRQWLNTSSEEVEFQADEALPAAAWLLREPLTQTVTLLSYAGNMIFAAPDLRYSSVPVAGLANFLPAPTLDGGEEPGIEFTWARSQIPLEVGDSYTVVSNHTAVTERSMREAGVDFPESIQERYLQLPDDFSPRIAALAQEVTDGHDTPYTKARALEAYLRGYTYDDKIAAPGPDQDPLEYFLFDIQQGYCDYYASAMATMLRSLEIPARTVSGYAEGTYDEESRLYFITEADAHTWVEVFFPGLGWIEFEPTAGESILSRPSGEELPENDRIPGRPDDLAAMDPFLFEEQYMGQNQFMDLEGQIPPIESAFQPTRWPWWVWPLLILAVLAAGVLLIRIAPGIGPAAFTVELPQLFYERLQHWSERLGLRYQPGTTPYEHADILGRTLPVGRPFIRRITDIYVYHRFSGRLSTRNSAPGSQDLADAELQENWQKLQPILWRKWLQQRLPLPRRGNSRQPIR